MKKIFLNKDKMNVNPAYNTWALLVYDQPDEKSNGVWIFLKSLDAEVSIDEDITCPPDWYFIECQGVKGYYKQNYQLIFENL